MLFVTAVVCKYFSLKNKAKHSVELMWKPDTHAVAGCENVVISTFSEEAEIPLCL